MSRILRAVALALVVCIAFSVAAQEKKVDATGTWKWTIPGRDGQSFEQSAKLKQEGEKLTGTVTGRQGAETAIEVGKIVGNELSFTVTREFNGNKFVSKHTGKIDGDLIKGTIAFDRGGDVQNREWEAKREKATPAPKADEVKPVAAGKATGTWKYTLKRDDGTELTSMLRLRQEGEKLTGMNIWNNGPEVAIEDGSVKGDTVAFTVKRERDGNTIVAKYSGKLEADKIAGTVTATINGEDRNFDITYEKVKE